MPSDEKTVMWGRKFSECDFDIQDFQLMSFCVKYPWKVGPSICPRHSWSYPQVSSGYPSEIRQDGFPITHVGNDESENNKTLVPKTGKTRVSLSCPVFGQYKIEGGSDPGGAKHHTHDHNLIFGRDERRHTRENLPGHHAR